MLRRVSVVPGRVLYESDRETRDYQVAIGKSSIVSRRRSRPDVVSGNRWADVCKPIARVRYGSTSPMTNRAAFHAPPGFATTKRLGKNLEGFLIQSRGPRRAVTHAALRNDCTRSDASVLPFRLQQQRVQAAHRALLRAAVTRATTRPDPGKKVCYRSPTPIFRSQEGVGL